MNRRTAGIYAVLALSTIALGLTGTAGAQVMPDRLDESQGWHDPDGAATGGGGVSGNESQEHNHLTCNIRPLSAMSETFSLRCTLLGHNSNAFVEWIRTGCQSGDLLDKKPIGKQMTGANIETIEAPVLTIDPRKCDRGWQEVRISDNMRLPGTIAEGGGRFFHTTRTCINFTVGNPALPGEPCGGPTQVGRCGGGGWYERTNYVLGKIDCRDLQKTLTRPLVPGQDFIRVKSQGAPVWLNLDPDFHNSNVGQVLVAKGAGNTWFQRTVPTGLSEGLHKFAIRAQSVQTREAGVYVVPFMVDLPNGATA